MASSSLAHNKGKDNVANSIAVEQVTKENRCIQFLDYSKALYFLLTVMLASRWSSH